MNTILANVKMPALISSAVVFPFFLIAIMNRKNMPEAFPYFLFGTLWTVMLIFVLIMRSIINSYNSGALHISTVSLVARTAFLIILGSFWISIVIDQMPCFLGGTNCD